MFRKHTQTNLDNKKIADDDRQHIVSVLGHVVSAHVEKASMTDCNLVAEALVRKYSFLSETDVLSVFHRSYMLSLFFSTPGSTFCTPSAKTSNALRRLKRAADDLENPKPKR